MKKDKYEEFKTKTEIYLESGKDAKDKINILITTKYQYIKNIL